jgi:hypothetical protein
VDGTRHTRFASLLLTLAIALAGGLAFAERASAIAVVVTPSIIGSGSVNDWTMPTPVVMCTASKAEDQTTACAAKGAGVPNQPIPVSLTITAFVPPQLAGTWTFVGWTGCSSTDGAKCTLSGPPQPGIANFTPVAKFVDNVGPATTIDVSSGPGEGALQAVNVETFVFSSTGATGFECQLDGGGFAACASGIKIEGLTAGAHRFEVRSIDAFGFRGVPAVRNWTVAPADADGDGFNALSDCNDTNPVIRPGANDVPGNGVDENCDGADATVPAVVQPPPVVQQPTTRDPEQVVVTLAFFSTAKKTTTKSRPSRSRTSRSARPSR